jgi:zinc finger SWIM domain-containing protein 3
MFFGLKHEVWRSMAKYDFFGDVITFDATYLTNRYDMTFAHFVGVNHHG